MTLCSSKKEDAMKTLILATAAAAFALVAGPALAYDQNFIDDTPSLLFRSAPVYSSGADLSVGSYRGDGGYTNASDHGRCIQAINANEASDVRAFCPQSKWNLVP
jgi:hypothetical protein